MTLHNSLTLLNNQDDNKSSYPSYDRPPSPRSHRSHRSAQHNNNNNNNNNDRGRSSKRRFPSFPTTDGQRNRASRSKERLSFGNIMGQNLNSKAKNIGTTLRRVARSRSRSPGRHRHAARGDDDDGGGGAGGNHHHHHIMEDDDVKHDRRKDRLFQNYSKRFASSSSRDDVVAVRSSSSSPNNGNASDDDDDDDISDYYPPRGQDSDHDDLDDRINDDDDDALRNNGKRSGSNRLFRPSNPFAPRQRGSTTSRNRDTNQYTSHDTNHDNTRSSHPFLLSSTATLSPRADLWMILSFTSCAAVSSFAMIRGGSNNNNNNNGGGTSNDKFALSVTAMTFAFSLLMAIGFRYGPGRDALTRRIGDRRTTTTLRRSGGGVCDLISHALSSWDVTPELVIVGVLSLFWMIAIPIIANGSTGAVISSGGSGGGNYNPKELVLAVVGADIWNANLFYASWASCALVVYLMVDLVTLGRGGRGGVVVSGRSIIANNTFSKRWILLVLNSIVILSSSAVTYTGPICEGMLSQTQYCQRAMIGIFVGGFLQGLVCLAVPILHRLSKMRKKEKSSRRRNSRIIDHGLLQQQQQPSSSSMTIISILKRNQVCFGLAILSLLVQAINVGLLTSPTGGGPATQSGTAYFSSWIGFFLAFELSLRYLELFTTVGASEGVGAGIGAGACVGNHVRGASVHDMAARSVGSRSTQSSTTLKKLPPAGVSVASTESSDDEEQQGPIHQIMAPDHQDVMSKASMSHYLGGPAAGGAFLDAHGGIDEPRDPYPDFVSLNQGTSLEPEATSYAGHSSSNSKGASTMDASWQPSGSSESNPPSFEGKNPDGVYNHRASLHYQEGAFSNSGSEQSNHADMYGVFDSAPPSRAESLDYVQPPSNNNPPSSISNKKHNNSQHSMLSNLSPLEEEEMNDSSPSDPNIVSSSNRSKSSGRSGSRGKSRRGENVGKSGNRRPTSSSGNHRNDPASSSDSGSGSNPPPTISDGASSKGSISMPSKPMSHARSRASSKKQNNSSRGSGPPPPPFPQQSSYHVNDLDETSQYSDYGNTAPMASIHTKQGNSLDTDTVVSDPTIDPRFDPPAPTASTYSQSKKSSSNNSGVGSTSSNEYHRSSSDENPSSVPDSEHVDDIVAAALAYAEKAHSEVGSNSMSYQNMGNSSLGKKSNASKSPGTHSHPSGVARQEEVHASEFNEESIHSFYSGPSGSGEGNKNANTNPSIGGSDVNDLVAQALSQVETTQQRRSTHQAQPPIPRQRSLYRTDAKSVGSMYSETTDYENVDQVQHFDC